MGDRTVFLNIVLQALMTNQLELAFDIKSICHLGAGVIFLKTKSIVSLPWCETSSVSQVPPKRIQTPWHSAQDLPLAHLSFIFSPPLPQLPLAPGTDPRKLLTLPQIHFAFTWLLHFHGVLLLSRFPFFLSSFCKLLLIFSNPQCSSSVSFHDSTQQSQCPPLLCSHRLLLLLLLKNLLL